MEKDFVPMRLSENLAITDVILRAERMFYDSDWEIVTARNIQGDNNNVQVDHVFLTRTDEETMEGMIGELRRCRTVADIKNLNMKNRIYYD